MKTIGVDIGTTTISFVIYEVEKDTVIEAITIQNGCFIKGRPEWEKIQDVSMIVSRAKETLDQLLDQYPNISAIGLTGQMHGIVYVNKEGESISPLYTWQDQRGNLSEFEGKCVVDQIKDICHISVPAGYGLATHCYQSKKNLVSKNTAFLCTIPDYLGMVLTGRKKPLAHSSMAASLGFFDSESGVYQKRALEAMEINAKILPEVTSELSILGYYRKIPVTAALGDSQASFLGTAGLNENTVLLNMGTGGQVSVLSEQYFQAPGIEARPFLRGKYLLTGSSLCGGRAYAILEHFFREYAVAAGAPDQPQYEWMAELAEKAVSADDSMTVVTTFNGTRANPDARGSISGLSEDNLTPGGLIRGVLTGMARELYDLYASICEGTGTRLEHIVASGNGLRKNRMLQQICQDMFQAELEISKHEEEAACGAAVSSAMWLGF